MNKTKKDIETIQEEFRKLSIQYGDKWRDAMEEAARHYDIVKDQVEKESKELGIPFTFSNNNEGGQYVPPTMWKKFPGLSEEFISQVTDVYIDAGVGWNTSSC